MKPAKVSAAKAAAGKATPSLEPCSSFASHGSSTGDGGGRVHSGSSSAVAPGGSGASSPPILLKESRQVAEVICRALHALAFAPLFVVVALQNVQPVALAVVLSAALCVCLACANVLFQRMGVVRVFPKLLDTFLLVLYGALVPVAYTHRCWLGRWLAPVHHGALAAFMWATVLPLPHVRPFVQDKLADRLGAAGAREPAARAAARRVSAVWAAALTAMCGASLAPALTCASLALGSCPAEWPSAPLTVGCDYVVALVALLAACGYHFLVSRRVSAAGADDWLGAPGTPPTAAPRPRRQQQQQQQQQQQDVSTVADANSSSADSGGAAHAKAPTAARAAGPALC